MPQAAAKLEPLKGLSPAVQRMVVEHHLDAAAIAGSGRDGRITKADVVRHVEENRRPSLPSDAAAPAPAVEAAPAKIQGELVELVQERQTRAPMTPLRQRVAERLVEVQQRSAILTTFNEADMSGVMALRACYKDKFKERHGIGLGFMSFFVKASIDALMTVPQVNTYIDGGDVVTNHYYDIGIAVSTDRGLVVPVLRGADRLSMSEVEIRIADFSRRAQERKLELSELTGAVFTISNGGIFGSMMSTPILNPPGSAILGMHAIKKRPVVIDDEIAVRPMMYLAVSYDHRIIDGREAVTFLKRIVECIENPERMLLEI
jgi:2-oxoglutarate dehydrogenase E2 component (dihydrolipoamide succinyltransferase)